MRLKSFSKIFTAVLLASAFFLTSLSANAQDAEFYTVKKGDTLWHISGIFLENPFKWPSVWRWNPYIPNPHLIYPGDVIKITAGGMELVERNGVKITPPPPPPSDVEPWPVEEEEWVPPVIEWVAPEIVEPPPAPKVAVNRTAHNSLRGDIVDESVTIDATIAMSVNNTSLIAPGDEVFVSFNDTSSVNVGDRYTIFTIEDMIYHPITEEYMGKLTRNVGSLVITDTNMAGSSSREKNAIVAKIGKVSQEILPGMHLKEYEELIDTIELVETTTEIDGFVVISLDKRAIISATDSIIIDRGEADGLLVGNILQIYRLRDSITDPLKKRSLLNLPHKNIGVVVVTEVRDNTSTCTVINSNGSIIDGDRVRTMGPLK